MQPSQTYTYTHFLQALHSIGLRKFFLAGLGPLGCIPNQLAMNPIPPGQCVSIVNEIIGPFNVGLKSLVDQLNANHPAAIFVYANAYGLVGDMLNKPSTYGELLSAAVTTGLAQSFPSTVLVLACWSKFSNTGVTR